MEMVDRGQVNRSAAEVYEEFFIPALFQQWTAKVADAARIQPGQRVLDIACGTGILARTVAERVGASGSVIGLDVNEGMLAVAARKAPQIEWRQGRAEALPFENDNFDAVVSQFGLMFFEDRPLAIREMLRVLRPGGRLAVAVWDSLEHIPGYAAMVDMLRRLISEEAANRLRAPFTLGNVQTLKSVFDAAGVSETVIETQYENALFPSISAWVYTDMKGWIFADLLDDTQVEMLQREAQQVLAPFVTTEGKVSFSMPAHIVSAIKS
jgi:ubiquinone/menaquinone biosynthesis C-methylase UbiE